MGSGVEPGRKRSLIVNADDFGLSRSVNRGIMDCHRSGIVTSVSLLANGAAFDDAVGYLKNSPQLGTGVHLNILRGRPVVEKRFVSHLIRQDHFSVQWPWFFFRLTKNVLAEITTEYRAQIEKIIKANIKITHLDGEKHHHGFPPLFEIVVQLAKEYSIGAVRLANEKPSIEHGGKFFKMAPIFLFSFINKKKLKAAGIKSTDHQAGIGITGQMNGRNIEKLLASLPYGVTELCCHPGYIDKFHGEEVKDFGSYYIDRSRDTEVRILTAEGIKQEILRRGIELMNYGDLR
jgi:predicted glycoside hydrolase/deacetylase ChbG (UPF0249 family)